MKIRDAGIIGVIAVSGLPHEEDHAPGGFGDQKIPDPGVSNIPFMNYHEKLFRQPP